MKISTSVVFGLFVGAAAGLVSMGTVVALDSRIGTTIHTYGWWIVLLSMLVPLADYLTGIRTTLMGLSPGIRTAMWQDSFAALLWD